MTNYHTQQSDNRQKHSRGSARWLWAIGLILMGLLVACGPTKSHPEGETLPSTMSVDNLPQVVAGEPLRLQIAPGGVYVVYEGEGPVTISVLLLENDKPVDIVITVLDSEWQQVAYHDGGDAGEETIARLDLGDSGPYIIWLNSFNGQQTGDVELLLTEIAVPSISAGDDSLIVDLFSGDVAQVMLDLDSSASFHITARSLTEDRDVRLAIVNVDGTVIASNDDHESDDATLGLLDAAIDLKVDDDAQLMLEIREYLGRSAQVEVAVTAITVE